MTVKLLPFDNKSELQVVVDLPRGASLEETDRVLQQAAGRLADLKELASIQSYAGTAAPFNFNGLVRHSYLRSDPEQGDLQINLTPKSRAPRTSHEIALDVRKRLAGVDSACAHSRSRSSRCRRGRRCSRRCSPRSTGPMPETRRAVATEVREICSLGSVHRR